MSTPLTQSSTQRAAQLRASQRSSRSPSSQPPSCCTGSSTRATLSHRVGWPPCSRNISTATLGAAHVCTARASRHCQSARATCRACTRPRSFAVAARTFTTRARLGKPMSTAPTLAPPFAISSCRAIGSSCPRHPRRATCLASLDSKSTRARAPRRLPRLKAQQQLLRQPLPSMLTPVRTRRARRCRCRRSASTRRALRWRRGSTRHGLEVRLRRC
mmetsp:Transcript_22055/g.56293  ORF Transcript_22055/g.56293 Transcript_22055/m.56293 type:complete len:216 (-) Transcript_22055:287-934(-)